ncbi:hypothetical protein Tco_0284966 [Tanacetum coccineum]
MNSSSYVIKLQREFLIYKGEDKEATHSQDKGTESSKFVIQCSFQLPIKDFLRKAQVPMDSPNKFNEASRVRFAKVYKAFSSEVHEFRLVFSGWGVKSLSTYPMTVGSLEKKIIYGTSEPTMSWLKRFLFALRCTDKSKITRKQSKTGKHGHENQKSTKPKPEKPLP